MATFPGVRSRTELMCLIIAEKLISLSVYLLVTSLAIIIGLFSRGNPDLYSTQFDRLSGIPNMSEYMEGGNRVPDINIEPQDFSNIGLPINAGSSK